MLLCAGGERGVMRVFTKWLLGNVRSVAVASLVGAALATSSTAQDTDAVRSAFLDWLDATRAQGVLTVKRNGRPWVTVEAGWDAQEPVELASLSKAITGICAAEMVRLGRMRWSDAFDDTVGRGPDITLAELVSQSGGIRKDSSQRVMRRTFDKPWSDAAEQILEVVEARKRFRGATGVHHYNNENYVLAGLMIEAAAGRAYEDVCADLAISPTGAQADLSPRSGAFAAWGGWRMSVEDYATWHSYWFAEGRATETEPTRFPHAASEGSEIQYGLGTYFRTLEPGNTFWHFGALCFPGRVNAGSYAASVFGTWTVVAAYDACIDWDAMFALDQAVIGALVGASP